MIDLFKLYNQHCKINCLNKNDSLTLRGFILMVKAVPYNQVIWYKEELDKLEKIKGGTK